MSQKCIFCKKELRTGERVGRGDSCEHCGADLHCCLQCHFYDPKAYNECGEPQAERVLEKEKTNFCDYFRLDPRHSLVSGRKGEKTEEAKKKWEDLFKK